MKTLTAKGAIIVRGRLVSRGQAKRAGYILYFKPNIPLALIEAKDNAHSVGDGMQQGLGYFSDAPQIGLTATPKETRYVSNIAEPGEPG